MLNFYLIEDDKSKSDARVIENLIYVGGLDDTTFYNLQGKGIVDDRFDFYSTFRWGTHLVCQLRDRVRSGKWENDIDVKALIILLELAGKHNSGLIAYGD